MITRKHHIFWSTTMAICLCFVATSSALALISQLTEWRPDRQSAALAPKVEFEPFPWSGATLSYDRSELKGSKAGKQGDTSQLSGRLDWPGQPPIA